MEIESGWKCIPPPIVLLLPQMSAGLFHKVTHCSDMQQTRMLLPTQNCPFSVRFSAASAFLNIHTQMSVYSNHGVNPADFQEAVSYHKQFVVEQFVHLLGDYLSLGYGVSRPRRIQIHFTQ